MYNHIQRPFLEVITYIRVVILELQCGLFWNVLDYRLLSYWQLLYVISLSIKRLNRALSSIILTGLWYLGILNHRSILFLLNLGFFTIANSTLGSTWSLILKLFTLGFRVLVLLYYFRKHWIARRRLFHCVWNRRNFTLNLKWSHFTALLSLILFMSCIERFLLFLQWLYQFLRLLWQFTWVPKTVIVVDLQFSVKFGLTYPLFGFVCGWCLLAYQCGHCVSYEILIGFSKVMKGFCLVH